MKPTAPAAPGTAGRRRELFTSSRPTVEQDQRVLEIALEKLGQQRQRQRQRARPECCGCKCKARDHTWLRVVRSIVLVIAVSTLLLLAALLVLLDVRVPLYKGVNHRTITLQYPCNPSAVPTGVDALTIGIPRAGATNLSSELSGDFGVVSFDFMANGSATETVQHRVLLVRDLPRRLHLDVINAIGAGTIRVAVRCRAHDASTRRRASDSDW